MRIETATNQSVTKDFLGSILDSIAKNTSFNYSVVAVNRIKEQLGEEFKFLRSVHIKNRSIEVSNDINSVNKNKLRKFFIRIIKIIGPNYLKVRK